MLPNQCDIVVLGERTLFVLSELGEIRWQKRLDFVPVALTLYPARREEEGVVENIIVTATTGAMMVYQDVHLVWSAKCDEPVLAARVDNFGSVPGLISTLAENGTLSLVYLGTDPPSQVVNAFESKDLDYAEMDDEHRRLLSIIREATSDTKTEPTEVVTIRAQVPSHLDHTGGGGYDDDGCVAAGRS